MLNLHLLCHNYIKVISMLAADEASFIIPITKPGGKTFA